MDASKGRKRGEAKKRIDVDAIVRAGDVITIAIALARLAKTRHALRSRVASELGVVVWAVLSLEGDDPDPADLVDRHTESVHP